MELQVFIDLKKAIDCVDHDTFLHKLDFHGIRALLVRALHTLGPNPILVMENKFSEFQMSDRGREGWAMEYTSGLNT